jgi:hypothetical protein
MRNRIHLASIITGCLFTITTGQSNAQPTLKILPLGNSITRGTMCLNGDIGSCVHLSDADAIGYRKRLYILMTAAGFNVDMVGNYNYGYGDGTFDSNNAGFDGIRDNELAEVM